MLNNGGTEIVIVGASVRAAAFSALRAGLRPWCADLFADLDLGRVCSAVRLPQSRYPQGFHEFLSCAPPAPWIYTGSLENRPHVVRQLAKLRPLWGNDAVVLRKVRRPWEVAACLAAKDIPCPTVRHACAGTPGQGGWLLKPLAGTGIQFLPRAGNMRSVLSSKSYIQEFIPGQPCAANYVADGHKAQLLGVTRQLVGEGWLGAMPFRYCGSIGPLRLDDKIHTAFVRMGDALTYGFSLRGLFGVDCVLQDGVPYPVEINPRYTASVEVLEHGTGVPAMAAHSQAFSPKEPRQSQRWWKQEGSGVVGKAIVFAREDVVVPDSGPWTASLDQSVAALRDFADIPHAGQRIDKGGPILTVFASGGTVASCLSELRHRVQDLDRWLYGN